MSEQQPVEIAPRQGMWTAGVADVSGYGGVLRPVSRHQRALPPYGGWFDEVAERLSDLVPALPPNAYGVDYGELTVYVPRESLLDVCGACRDDAWLRFEVMASVSGVHYPDEAGAELHCVYHLLSITHNRRLRLEVAVAETDPVVDSVTAIYPMADWHERETWDMFGIEFAGHPGLTRILMPDDWEGHPQRKDYPLGGVPLQFKGAEVPPPNQRRAYL